LPGDAATGDFHDGVGDLPALLGGKLLVRRWHRHPCLLRQSTDAQSITNPHKAPRGGDVPRWPALNKADHSLAPNR
jgi:hypothetical protein